MAESVGKTPAKPKVGDVVTIVAVKAHCGVPEGFSKKIKVSGYVLDAIAAGWWKVK